MADDATKNLLLKIVGDTSNFDEMVKKLRATLEAFDDEEQARAAKAQKDLQAANAAQKEQLATLQKATEQALANLEAAKKTTAEKKAQSEADKSKTASEKAAAAQKLAWEKELASQQRRADAEIEASRKKELASLRASILEQSKLRDEEHKRELARIKAEEAERKREAAELARENAKRPGGLAGLLTSGLGAETAEATSKGAGGILRGLLGGGVAGSVATGAFLGTATISSIEAVGEGIEHLIDKFKELVNESGKLTQVENTFTRLAHSKGIEDTDKFLDELREKTHNLVADMDLFRTANTFLQSSMHISKEEMLKLTEATVNLARANGSTATEAMNALNRFFITGYARSLGMVTGIQRNILAVKGLGAALTETQRMQANFEQARKVIEGRSQLVGQPTLTVQEAITGFSNVRGRLEEAFGQGLTQSSGLQEFSNTLQRLTDRMGGLEGAAHKMGDSVGKALQGIGNIIETVVNNFGKIVDVLEVIGAWFVGKGLAGLITWGVTANAEMDSFLVKEGAAYAAGMKLGEAIRSITPNILLTSGILMIQHALSGIKDDMTTITGETYTWGDAVKGVLAWLNPIGGYGNLFETVRGQHNIRMTQERIDTAREGLLSGEKVYGNDRDALIAQFGLSPTKSTGDEDEDIRNRRKLEQMRLKDQRAALQEETAATKAQLEEIKDDYDESYKSGFLDMKQYYDDRRGLIEADYNLQRHVAEETHRITYEDIKARRGEFQDYTNAQAKVAMSTADKQLQSAYEKANLARTKGLFGVGVDERRDTARGAISGIELELKAKKDALGIEQQITESTFKEGLISGQEYLEQRIKQINAEVEAQRQASADILQEKLKTGTWTPADVDSQIKAYKEAQDNAQKQIQGLVQNAPSTILEGYTRTYQSQIGMIQAGQGLFQSTGVGGDLGSSLAMQQQMINVTQNFREQLQGELKDLKESQDPLVKHSQTWYQIYTQITQVTEKVNEYTKQLKEMQSLQPAIGNVISTFGEQLQGLFGSYFARGLERAFSGVGKQLQGAPGLVTTLTSGNTFGQDLSGLGSIIGPLFGRSTNVGGDEFNPFYGGGDTNKVVSPNDAFNDLTKKTVALTAAFGNFLTTIEQSGSATAGAFSGTVGGASLGSSLASSTSLTGGAAGALTGGLAAAGLVFGMISGQKQEQVQDDINQLNVSFKAITDAMSTGNASLQQTIQNLQALIAEAQADMANTKKGSGQFKQLILQYQEQITSLQNQAEQTMTKLQEQLDILSSPTPYQGMVSSIESVVEQYSQFVGAAQNTEQLAQANQYLTQSLQQLAEGYSEQLLQDEETAVQNAINLNNLMNQRNQLQYQYLQQTESIMGQGTITRGQTLSQSKYAQLYQASVNYSNQLMDINEQIAVAQAQVTAAQTVFQLATTRQGLESQMVTLQTASIQLDMQRIAAMSNMLQMLQQTGYSITNLSGISTSDPNQLILQILAALLSQLGLGSGSSSSMSNLINTLQGIMSGSASGGSGLTSLAAAAYAGLARQGKGGFSGIVLG